MECGREAAGPPHPERGGGVLPGVLIPLAALGLQWFFWDAIRPYVWFFFYPAVFFSGRVGGLRGGLAGTALSTVIVWWFFIPPRFSFALERPASALSVAIFALVGVLFSFTHERLRRANQQIAAALASVSRAKESLEEQVEVTAADLTHLVDVLRQSEEKYRLMLDSMLEGCQIIGSDWRYLYLNGAAQRHNRRPNGELIGRTVMECWPGIVDTAVFALEERCMRERTSHRMENEFLFPDGHVGWFRLIIQPVQEGIAIYSEDITERKRAEEALVRLNAELEERVRERTARVEEVNRQLETFSYSVSHDLKAPLRGIDGYSRLLEEDHLERLDEEGRLFVANIRSGAAQMHQLIEDLLRYSRMERRSVQTTTLDLAALVQRVVAEHAAEAEREGVTLTVHIPPLAVRADRDGLAMVLRNLLENAIKFSRRSRPPAVEVGARTDGDAVLLWVRDNGIGFDMKFHDRIFDIFQRLQRAEEYPGTGIGLALVRKAMERMEGKVWAESAPGAGATFFLEIPR